jgi:hypothetical protein
MKSLSMPLIGLGALIIIFGAINHFVIKANPVHHFSTILGVVGVVLAAIGAVAMMAGGSKA